MSDSYKQSQKHKEELERCLFLLLQQKLNEVEVIMHRLVARLHLVEWRDDALVIYRDIILAEEYISVAEFSKALKEIYAKTVELIFKIERTE